MKNKIIQNLLFVVALLMSNSIFADCYKCEEIREKNKKLPPLKHEYYDDYLEELKAEGKTLPGDYQITDESSTEEEAVEKAATKTKN